MKKVSDCFPFITLCLGQSEGREVRVIKWEADGATLLAEFPIVWNMQDGKWYDLPALKTFWTFGRMELEGKSLADLIAECKIFGFTSWGADVVLLDADNNIIAAVNYPSPLGDEKISADVDGMPRDWWHTNLGGAAQAAYQPIGTIRYMKDRMQPGIWGHVKHIVPMTDFLGFLLHGKTVHDPTMLQSQGLYGDALGKTASRLQDLINRKHLCPWEKVDTDAVLGDGPTLYIPGSHDSVFARLVGFAMAKFVVWTGTWIGVAADAEGSDLVPNATTLELGLSFEGLAPRAVQKNTAKFGAAFEELKKRSGLSYEMAAQAVMTQGSLPELDLSGLDGIDTASAAADHVIERLRKAGSRVTDVRALAAVVDTAARTVSDDLKKVSQATGEPLDKVAIVGGWAKNSAFREKLAGYSGAEVVIPPKASRATEVGYAADMVWRVLKKNGVEMKLTEVLSQLPEISL